MVNIFAIRRVQSAVEITIHSERKARIGRNSRNTKVIFLLTLHNTWTTIDPDYDGCEVLLVEVDHANHLSLLAGKALLSSVIVIAIAPLSLAS